MPPYPQAFAVFPAAVFPAAEFPAAAIGWNWKRVELA
jgi:hypothetical protein